jgi:hypothetical protein
VDGPETGYDGKTQWLLFSWEKEIAYCVSSAYPLEGNAVEKFALHGELRQAKCGSTGSRWIRRRTNFVLSDTFLPYRLPCGLTRKILRDSRHGALSMQKKTPQIFRSMRTIMY